MNQDDITLNNKRRAIEDSIVQRFYKVDFTKAKHAYLEDDDFQDFVFSWYDLVKHYESTQDTAIGAHMLDLYTQCGQKFRQAATDSTLRERRRDKASDAIYQMTYYVDRMLKQAERNGIEKEQNNPTGNINWRDDSPTSDTSNLN